MRAWLAERSPFCRSPIGKDHHIAAVAAGIYVVANPRERRQLSEKCGPCPIVRSVFAIQWVPKVRNIEVVTDGHNDHIALRLPRRSRASIDLAGVLKRRQIPG